MSKWNLLVPLGAFICTVFAGPARADTYRTIASGSWFDLAIWEVEEPDHPGKWRCASRLPYCIDSTEIKHTIHVDGSVHVWVVTIDSGASLTIDAIGSLELCGSNPQIIVNGDFFVLGVLTLTSDAGIPLLDLRGAYKVPAAGGIIRGASAGTQAIIRIHGVSGPAEMDNLGTVSGNVLIEAARTYPGYFRNYGLVSANASAGIFTLSPSLAVISDDSSARWEVSGTAATLKFDIGSTSLAGSISVLGTSLGLQELIINDSVSTSGSFTYNRGTIYVDFGQTLCASGTHAGSCVGSLPFSGSCLSGGVYAPCP